MKHVVALCLLLFAATAGATDNPDWSTPIAPFQIADNLYYVGSRDLAAYLVVTSEGNILINANLSTSPPQIRASVEKLGFRWSDIRILLNSQAHFDHVAGAAEIIRETHAQNEVMEGDVAVFESGGKTDFLVSSGSLQTYPPAQVDRVLKDGDVVSLGGVQLTAHKTAGHTRGCTTWTMRSHVPGDPSNVLRDVVIVGGVSFWSDFHFVDSHDRPASYPGIAEDFRRTFTTLHGLHCDIFLGAHGEYFDMLRKRSAHAAPRESVWIDPAGYRRFIDGAERHFRDALDKEMQAAAK